MNIPTIEKKCDAVSFIAAPTIFSTKAGIINWTNPEPIVAIEMRIIIRLRYFLMLHRFKF